MTTTETCKGLGYRCGKPVKGSRTIETRRRNHKTGTWETIVSNEMMCGIHIRTYDNRVKARADRERREALRVKNEGIGRAKKRAVMYICSQFEQGAKSVSFSEVVGFAPGKWGNISNDAELTDGTTLGDLMQKIKV